MVISNSYPKNWNPKIFQIPVPKFLGTNNTFKIKIKKLEFLKRMEK